MVLLPSDFGKVHVQTGKPAQAWSGGEMVVIFYPGIFLSFLFSFFEELLLIFQGNFVTA